MSLDNYYLRGPLEIGDKVFLAAIYTYQGYTDLYWVYRVNTNYIFSCNFTGQEPTVFELGQNSTTQAGVTLYDGKSYLGPNLQSSCQCLATAWDTPQNLAQVTTQVAPWGLFLAGVEYNFTNIQFQLYPWQSRDSSNPCVPLGQDTGNIQQIANFHVVPIKWYINNQNCSIVDLAYKAYLYENDWFYVNSCQRTPPFTLTGFVRASDCQAGVFYNYCLPGGSCGGNLTTGCAGPCSTTDTTCGADTATNAFVCTTPTSTGISWWVWLILGLLVLGVIVIFFIVAVFFIYELRKSKK